MSEYDIKDIKPRILQLVGLAIRVNHSLKDEERLVSQASVAMRVPIEKVKPILIGLYKEAFNEFLEKISRVSQ